MTQPWSKQTNNEDNFQIEGKITLEIMETVHRLQLPFKLEGKGNKKWSSYISTRQTTSNPQEE